MYTKGTYRNGSIELDNGLDIDNGTEVFLVVKFADDEIRAREWNIQPEELVDLSPVKARNLLVRCFTVAHLEEVLRKKKKKLTVYDFETAKKGLIAEVQLGFKQLDLSFEHPSKAGLAMVLKLLAEKQINRGLPASIVDKHRSQLENAIQKLGE